MPTQQIETHLKANANMSKKNIMASNFLGGLSWGFGSVVGATVVIAIIGTVLGWFGLLDFFKQLFQRPY